MVKILKYCSDVQLTTPAWRVSGLKKPYVIAGLLAIAVSLWALQTAIAQYNLWQSLIEAGAIPYPSHEWFWGRVFPSMAVAMLAWAVAIVMLWLGLRRSPSEMAKTA